MIVKAVSEQGERLNIRKATLREWREEFASHLRDRVEAVATGLREADRTGDPAKLQVRETRRGLERGWLAASDALRSQGQSALANQTRQFVRYLPPARTEREWLIAGFVEQGGNRRARELEMTR